MNQVIANVQWRNNMTWWASFLIVVVLAATLLGGVIGAIITVLADGASPWAALFGGISAADLLTFILARPEQALDRANRKATLYALLFNNYLQQFNGCLTLPTSQQSACLQQAWGDVQQAIAWIDATAKPPPPPKP